MSIGIYGIFSHDDDQCLWVGQSVDVEFRYRRHLYLLSRAKHRLEFNSWFIEHGSSNSSLYFSFLEETEKEEMNEREGYWFHLLQPRFFGQLPSMSRKWFLTDEVKAKMSASQKAYIADAKDKGVYVSPWDLADEKTKTLMLEK